MQIFLVAALTDSAICCCISGDKASLSPLDSTSRGFLCRAEELIDSTVEERISARKDLNAVIINGSCRRFLTESVTICHDN